MGDAFEVQKKRIFKTYEFLKHPTPQQPLSTSFRHCASFFFCTTYLKTMEETSKVKRKGKLAITFTIFTSFIFEQKRKHNFKTRVKF